MIDPTLIQALVDRMHQIANDPGISDPFARGMLAGCLEGLTVAIQHDPDDDDQVVIERDVVCECDDCRDC